MLKRIVIVLILIVWPLSLFLANTPANFFHYLFPVFDPKLTLLPFLFVLLNFKKQRIIYLILAILLLVILFRPFIGQTILIPDYERSQQNLQKSNLYNSIPLARIFQNKLRIPLDKLSSKFFALIDPNNYFFGFAPRQITIDNQNLKKFPFLSLPFFLIGLYYLKQNKYWKIIVTFLVSAIINLSLLTNFDRNDFILWIPISLIIIHGINIFNKRFKYAKYYQIVFVIFSSIEIIRIFIK